MKTLDFPGIEALLIDKLEFYIIITILKLEQALTQIKMRLNLRRIFQHSPQHIKIRSTLVFDDIEMPVCLGNPLLSDPADVFETLIGIVCFSAAGGPDVFPQDYLQGAHRRNIPAHVLGHASKSSWYGTGKTGNSLPWLPIPIHPYCRCSSRAVSSPYPPADIWGIG